MYMVSQCHILSSTKEGPMELKWIIVLKTCEQSPIIKHTGIRIAGAKKAIIYVTNK